MAVQGGYGVLLKITVGTVLTTVANLLDVDFPKFTKFVAESTGHSATSGYYTAVATGKRRLQPFSAKLGWDKADSTHAAIVTAFGADTSVNMSIQDPDGTEIIAFAAIVEEIERISKQEDMYIANVIIHPTGPATITP
jgi:hypothetical protein